MSDGIVARIVSEALDPSSVETNIDSGKQIDTLHPDPSKVVPPFTQYSELRNKPYSADYFKIGYYNMISEKYDPHNVYKNISEVEKYVTESIKTGKLVDDINTYRSLIDSIKNKLSIKDFLKPEQQLKIVGEYLRLKDKEKKQNEKLEKVKSSLLKVIGANNG